MTNGTELPPSVLLALATGRMEIARHSLFKIVKAEPTNTFGWLCLAVTLPREQAIQALQRVLILEPDNPVALRNLPRLRQSTDPDIALELADVLQPEAVEEEPIALFGNEQSTINLRRGITTLGQEMPTLLDVTHPHATFSSKLKAIKQLPPLPGEIAEPEIPPAKPPKPETISSAKIAKAEAIPPAKVVKPEIIPPATKKVDPRYNGFRATAQLNPEVVITKSPEKSAEAALKEGREKLPPAKKPSAPTMPLNMARLAAIPLNGKDSSPVISADLVSGHLAGAADGGANFKPKPFMPRLNNGPRPTLGMVPRPLVGFTTFGVLISLLLILLLVFCFVLLASGGGAAVPMEIPTPTK